MKTYAIQGIFSPLTLIIGQDLIVKKRSCSYSVNRKEAANLLKVAKREKSVKKIVDYSGILF